MSEAKTLTVDELRERIDSDEWTEDDFYLCFEFVSDSNWWPEFGCDWRAVFEAVLRLQPGEIEDYSLFDIFISCAAADGFTRGIRYAAEALGVNALSLDAAVHEWHETDPEKRPEPSFETVQAEIVSYEQWEKENA